MRLETHFDDQLRERADAEDRLRKAIAEQRADLETLRDRLADETEQLDRTRLGRTLNRLADHLRLAGDCKEARRLCDEAIAIWRDLGRRRAVFLARLRRADIETTRGRHGAALEEGDALVEAADDEPFAIYRDFALELRGRVRARSGDPDGAVADLEEARTIRRREGRDRLAVRTESLLALVRERR